MKTISLLPRAKPVGVVGLGTMALGGHYGGRLDDREAIGLVHQALDLGVNLIDTADVYGRPPGRSEELVGKALTGRRERACVATKVGNYARPEGHPLAYSHPLHVELCCDASLKRLRIESIDLYQCHLNRLTDPEVFLEAFDRLIDKGKIRHFGVSTNSEQVLRGFNRDGRCAACQLDYSLLHRKPEDDILPYCKDAGIATLIRGPLDKGVAAGRFTTATRFDDPDRQTWNRGPMRALFLEKLDVVEALRAHVPPGRTLGELAIAFVLSHPAVTCTIPGASSIKHLEKNAAAATLELDDAALNAIETTTRPALSWG